MTHELIVEQTCLVLSEYTIETVTPESELKRMLKDSLSLIQALMAVEEFFHLEQIPGNDIDRFVTVRDVIYYVEQHA